MGLDLFVYSIDKKTQESKEELAYFRKVNFLIPYFEDYYDVEVENCKHLPISKECCENLVDICEDVLNNHEKGEEILPTRTGFFFGDTKYDEYYYEDIEYVRDKFKYYVIPAFDDLNKDEEISFFIWY